MVVYFSFTSVTEKIMTEIRISVIMTHSINIPFLKFRDQNKDSIESALVLLNHEEADFDSVKVR